jgi:cytolysin (calcineurin-like family phosphatase)
MQNNRQVCLSRRDFTATLLGLGGTALLPARSWAADGGKPAFDAAFLFAADIHACRMGDGLSPNCEQEGKTDANLLRHIAALNRIDEQSWPAQINGIASGLAGAGRNVDTPLGVIIGGDITDDGGGQVALPSEGAQLQQFSQRYQQGIGPDRVHFPVYVGLGNHDLDQDGLRPHVDWYRRELRDYVEINHRQSVFFKPPVPAANYDLESDSYSWEWGGLHLIQTHRFAGDTNKGAPSGLPWLRQDLADNAGDGRPVVIFQHYGWDSFSTEKWDPAAKTFDEEGTGPPHWWSDQERQAMISALTGYNVIGVFHGHQHETAMIYQRDGLDLFKPKASYLGGFALIHVTDTAMDVVLAEATDAAGNVRFTNAFSKPVGWDGK